MKVQKGWTKVWVDVHLYSSCNAGREGPKSGNRVPEVDTKLRGIHVD